MRSNRGARDRLTGAGQTQNNARPAEGLCVAIPDRIWVSRDGGNFSSCMGDYDLGLGDEANQFWGRVVAFHTRPPEPRPAGWYPEKRWYAVLHRFDSGGDHLGCMRFVGGGTLEAPDPRRLMP